MQYVTLVNRTNEVLSGTWDGRHYDIKPGKHQFPEMAALKFRDQNPVMGTEDPRTGRIIYKIGIEEHGDITTPLDAGLYQASIEKWDRTKLTGAPPTEVVQGDNGLYQMGRTAGSGTLPAGAGFVDPNRD